MTEAAGKAAPSENLDRIAAALVRHGVNYVVIGGWAVQAQNYDLGYLTQDIDFTPEPDIENMNRLSAALKDLDARVRIGGESFPFNHDGESLSRASMWNLTCNYGDFDLCFELDGVGGYHEVIQAARTVTLDIDDQPTQIRCADLAHIVASKRAADRPKDQQSLTLLAAQLDERKNPPDGPG